MIMSSVENIEKFASGDNPTEEIINLDPECIIMAKPSGKQGSRLFGFRQIDHENN